MAKKQVEEKKPKKRKIEEVIVESSDPEEVEDDSVTENESEIEQHEEKVRTLFCVL
jgi:hypothetical protein